MQINKKKFVTIIVKLPSTSAITDDGTKLSDSLIDQNMIESHMMEPVDGTESIHFDRTNGDDLADNQDLANDRCVYVCVEVIWLLYVVYFVCIWVHCFDLSIVTRWIVIAYHQRTAALEKYLPMHHLISKPTISKWCAMHDLTVHVDQVLRLILLQYQLLWTNG